jgi:ParB-like chromosome segregation protein Spo0J
MKQDNTKLAIKYKKTADLTPYAKNSRTHSDTQIAQLVASLQEFGFTNPILLDGANGIIAGHGRLKAAQQLGYETVPTIELGNMSDEQRRAYIIADNKLALNAGWDTEMLAFEIESLQDAGYDLGLTGFNADELKALTIDEQEQDEGDYKEPVDENRNLLMIECIGERELQNLFTEMKTRGFECKILS